MDDVIAVFNSISLIFMFFCVICMFGKIVSDDSKKYKIFEIVFVTLIILSEVVLIHSKYVTGEEYRGNIFGAVVCISYGICCAGRLSEKKEDDVNSKESEKIIKK